MQNPIKKDDKAAEEIIEAVEEKQKAMPSKPSAQKFNFMQNNKNFFKWMKWNNNTYQRPPSRSAWRWR